MTDSVRNTIKNNLQKLSKDELVDVLADIYMTYSTINMANAVCSIQCTIPPISSHVQCINNQFASIQQPIVGLENGLKSYGNEKST